MNYIPAEKMIAEIERWRDKEKEKYNESTYSMGRCDALAEFRNHIVSLLEEQPDNEDIDKVAQELYEHLYELKRRNNVPTNLYDKQEIIDLWKAGIEYGRNHPKQEQSEDIVVIANTFLDALSKTPYNNKPITDAQVIVRQLLLFFENPKEYNPDAIVEQPNNMIQWTGQNLWEVVSFTGKSPKFGEWFKSWEDLENYVHSHDNILKLFCEDGSHYEVPVGAWIVKTPDGYNVPSVAKYIQQEQSKPTL